MSQIYDSGLFALLNPPSGAISYINDDIKILLVTPSYIFLPSHVHVSDINNELTDPSYLRQLLTGKTQVLDSVNRRVLFSSAPPLFSNLANSTPNAAILFKDLGTGDSNAQIIAYCDFSTGTFIATGLDFTILLPNPWFAIPITQGGS